MANARVNKRIVETVESVHLYLSIEEAREIKAILGSISGEHNAGLDNIYNVYRALIRAGVEGKLQTHDKYHANIDISKYDFVVK